MALTGYLKLPDIDGESVRADHEGEIDVHGVHWQVKQRSSANIGSGRTQARAEISGMTLYKVYDASSPYLALTAMLGKAIDEAVLMVRKDSGEAHLDYLTVTMKKCVIAEYEMTNDDPGEDGSQVIREKLVLSFEEVAIKYVVQADDHSKGDEHEIEYSVAAGK
ncbi:MAG: type VI secretion system tube protein Hcp [Tabrizicola sp.]|nr:type VI secretion system tube protein Hcp [Tabrizicola sp.]